MIFTKRRTIRIVVVLVCVTTAMVMLGGSAARVYKYAVAPRKDFEHNLKKRVDPEQLREWANQLLASSRSNKIYGRVSTGMHPAFINLSHFKPRAFTVAPEEGALEHVNVIYDAGHFGYWGVEIGATNYLMPIKSGSRDYVPWAPGIYFYYGSN